MIPYFEVQNLYLGPVTIQIWGLMVGIGILLATSVSTRLARIRDLDPKVIWDSVVWIILGAFVGARLFHVIFYDPTYFAAHPLDVLAVWRGGLSMVGGLIGASILGIWILKRKKVSVWQYADVIAFGLPLGSFMGRIGCFLKHLHPGTRTNFFLGVRYPDDIIRHDLGLYLSINGFVMFFVFLFLLKSKIAEGWFLILYLIWYGTVRFFMDFFRAYTGSIVDTRYFGLTPTQYFSVMMIFAGLILAFWFRSKASSITFRD